MEEFPGSQWQTLTGLGVVVPPLWERQGAGGAISSFGDKGVILGRGLGGERAFTTLAALCNSSTDQLLNKLCNYLFALPQVKSTLCPVDRRPGASFSLDR